MNKAGTTTVRRPMKPRPKPVGKAPNVFGRTQDAATPATDVNGSVVVFAHRKLGEIMVFMGLITQKQKERILKRQERWGRPFGECATRMRLVKPNQLQKALSAQFACQFPTSGNFKFTKDMVMAYEPFSEYGEALRTLANRLLDQWWTPKDKTLAITSAEPGEGRSHLAANLAIGFALFGRRTLLVDADFRRPRQHEIFGVNQHPGFSRMLCGFTPEELVRPISFLRNLGQVNEVYTCDQ